MINTSKVQKITELKEAFEKSNAVFFADYKGLTVEQLTDFRRKLRPLKTKVKVVKNNLARIATKELNSGAETSQLLDRLAGPTLATFAFGDPSAVAKVISKFADDNEVFSLKESLLDSRLLTVKEVQELSKLPSREVLLAKMLSVLNGPVTGFVGVLAAVPRSLVQVLSAIEAKKRD